MTNEEIKDYIYKHGLEFPISEGVSSNSIKDVNLRKLWKTANRALQDIRNYLQLD